MSLAGAGTGKSGLISTSHLTLEMGGSFSHHVSVTLSPVLKSLGFSCHHRKGEKQRLRQRSIAMERDVFPKEFGKLPCTARN